MNTMHEVRDAIPATSSFFDIMFSLCIFECSNHAFLSMILIGTYGATNNSHNVQ